MNNWIIALIIFAVIVLIRIIKKGYGHKIWDIVSPIIVLITGFIIAHLLSKGADWKLGGSIMDIASKFIYIITVYMFVVYCRNKHLTWMIWIALIFCAIFYKNVLAFFGF